MKILYLNYEWDPRESTGAMTHIRELTRGLVSLGHTVSVVDRRRMPTAPPAAAGVKSTDTLASGNWRQRFSPYLHEAAAMVRALSGISKETEVIHRERPDVVLTRHSLHQFSSILAAHRCGVPVVYEVNAPAAYEYRHYRSQYFLIPGFAEWLEARMLKRTDGMFVVSEVLRKHFVQKGIPLARIHVIPNGADVERFASKPADPLVRRQLGEGNVIVGFVGSFARFHGIDQLVEAIDFLCAERSDARFLLVGSGEMSGRIQEHCKNQGMNGRVYFTGHVSPERVPSLMAASDILLAPYAPEDFFYLSPIKIFEYMAAGKAVLAAQVGQVGEVIQNGINGVLYDPADAESLRSALRMLAEGPELRKRLGESARRTIAERYTWRANAAGVEALLMEALESRKESPV